MVLLLEMKSIMPSLKLPRLCTHILTIIFLYYLVFSRRLQFLHMFWNFISASSWWWWTAYYIYAKGRGWKVSSLSLRPFFHLALVKTTMKGLNYIHISWSSQTRDCQVNKTEETQLLSFCDYLINKMVTWWFCFWR